MKRVITDFPSARPVRAKKRKVTPVGVTINLGQVFAMRFVGNASQLLVFPKREEPKNG